MNKPERQTNCTSETDVDGIGGGLLFAGDGVNSDIGTINYSCHTGTRVWISDLDGNGHINCEEEILQVRDYYPFGMPHDLPEEVDLPALPYRDADPFTYNNKEYEDRVTRMHDYHARWYDAALGRWSVVDPLAEHPKQVAISPYHYAYNNPVRFIDPDGKIGRERTYYEKGDGATHYVQTNVTRNVGERQNEDGTTTIVREYTETRTTIRQNEETGAAEVVGTSISVKTVEMTIENVEVATETYGETMTVQRSVGDPEEISNVIEDGDILGSNHHVDQLKKVQKGLNSLAYGKSLTQDRSVMNDVMVGVGGGQYLASKIFKRAVTFNKVSAGVLLTYSVYDLVDRKFGNHTGRRMHLGTSN